MGALHEDQYAILIISRLIILRMRCFRQNLQRKSKFTFYVQKFSRKLWDNVEKYGTAGPATDDNIVWCMRTACRITKATNTYSEYVILIAFPLQQWLHERASVLLYMFIDFLIMFRNVFQHISHDILVIL